jgi:hypothetical protein
MLAKRGTTGGQVLQVLINPWIVHTAIEIAEVPDNALGSFGHDPCRVSPGSNRG